MITYVNTVLVGTNVGTMASSIDGAANGEYVVVDNNGTLLTAATAANAEAIKVGLKTDNGIKWSNIIKKADLKSYHHDEYANHTSDVTEDTITVDFGTALNAAAALEDGKKIRVVVRLTFKDLPTRFRKWTESYEVVTDKTATAESLVNAFVKTINDDNAKRARVTASNDSNKLKLVAMPYTDDNSVDSISPANKVRFSANAWYTLPGATGFDSKNKYTAASITKVPGKYYAANWKLVRDAEAQAMGYAGVLNRGEGTWPIIKPEMNVVKNANYDYLTLEFENMYRTADDLQRRTKQTLEIFDQTTKLANVRTVIEAFIAGTYTSGTAATAAQLAAATSDAE